MLDPDYLIVGGGSAGAVLAARLSENPSSRVLLVEAGADTPPDAVPADISDLFPSSSLNPVYFWPGLRAQRRPGGPLYPFPQARIMGGGSSIMGMWALRGLPWDFQPWVAAGAQGWGADDLYPVYRRLENDLDRDLGQRNASAPYTIRRVPREQWPRIATSIEHAVAARGTPDNRGHQRMPWRRLFSDAGQPEHDGAFVKCERLPDSRSAATIQSEYHDEHCRRKDPLRGQASNRCDHRARRRADTGSCGRGHSFGRRSPFTGVADQVGVGPRVNWIASASRRWRCGRVSDRISRTIPT